MSNSKSILVGLGPKGAALEVPRRLPPCEKMRYLAGVHGARERVWAIMLRHLVKGKSPNDCWSWNGSVSELGYGRVNICADMWLAHRVSFWYHNGRISEKLHICHHCDNPPCCNPDHLFEGTALDNQRDAKNKKRNAHGEKSAQSVLSERDVRMIRASYIPNKVTHSMLAKQFGVSIGCIEGVTQRYNWKHI